MKKAPPADLTAVRIIPRDAVLDLRDLSGSLGVSLAGLKRAARLGQLRVSRRCGRYWVLGAWVHEWLEGGCRTKRKLRPAREVG